MTHDSPWPFPLKAVCGAREARIPPEETVRLPRHISGKIFYIDKGRYMKIHDISTFVNLCRELGISLTQRQAGQFLSYYEFLTEKNKVMNLTAITKYDEVVTKHFLDSLLIVKAVDLSGVSSVMDLGTGAGFPGIPLKIAFPDLNITLADSLQKRIHFLDECIQLCGLEKIRTIHGRAEDLGRDGALRESYDLVVSRAVANLSSLSEYCLPFVKVGGRFVAYKSAAIEEEFHEAEKAVRILGGRSVPPVTETIPGTDLKRSFVIIEKKAPTPKKYPRKAGTPGKDPIR